MFLGTDSERAAFWIEPNIEQVLKTLEHSPETKFFLIKVVGVTVVIRPVIIADNPTEVTISRREATVDGEVIN